MSGFVNFGVRASQKTALASYPLTSSLPDGVTFARASIGTYFDSNPLMVTATTNEPRFDHDPVTGAAIGILLEEQSTNLNLDSGDLSGWSAQSSSLVSSLVIGPDGASTLKEHRENTSTALHYITDSQRITLTSGETYTSSAFVKDKEVSSMQLLTSTTVSSKYTNFDISSGALGTSTAEDAGVINHDNDLYRIHNTITLTGSNASIYPNIFAHNDNDTSSTRLPNYLGSNRGYYIGFVQAELGDKITSYIPTTTTAVTRFEDQLTIDVPANGTSARVYFDNGSTQDFSVLDYAGSTYTLDPSTLDRTHVKKIEILSEYAAPTIYHDYTLSTVPSDGFTTFSRASCSNSAQFYDQPLGDLTPYGANVPRFLRGGLLIEESRQNQFLNAAAPVSQTITLATYPYYCVWMKGTGSLTVEVGTALGNVRQMAGIAYDVGELTMQSDSMTVTDGEVLIFNATTLGTINVTVNGSVDIVQFENGPGPTTFIPTTSTTQVRANDYLIIDCSTFWHYDRGTFFADVMFLSGGRGNVGNNHLAYTTSNGGTPAAAFPKPDIITGMGLVLGINSRKYTNGADLMPWRESLRIASRWSTVDGTSFTFNGLDPDVYAEDFPPVTFTTSSTRLGDVLGGSRCGSMIWFKHGLWETSLTPEQIKTITS